MQIYKLLSVVVRYFSTCNIAIICRYSVGGWFRFMGAFTLGFDKWNIIRKFSLGADVLLLNFHSGPF